MKNDHKILIMIYHEAYKLRKEIRDSFIIEIVGALAFFVLQFLIISYNLPRFLLDIYGIGIIVALPFYFLFQMLKKDRIIYRQTAAWLIFCVILTPTALVDNFISDHYHKSNPLLKLSNNFLYQYIPDMLSAPFNVFISVLAYHVMTRFWPHSKEAI